MTNLEYFTRNNTNLLDAHTLFIKSDCPDNTSFWNWLGFAHEQENNEIVKIHCYDIEWPVFHGELPNEIDIDISKCFYDHVSYDSEELDETLKDELMRMYNIAPYKLSFKKVD